MIEITAVPPRPSVAEDDPVRIDSELLVESRFASYLSDESGLGPGKAQTIFFPTSERQIVEFLREMNAKKVPVTVSGGRTGIVGGAVPQGGAVMSLDRMNRVVGIRWDETSREWRVTVEPGVRLKDLQERITRRDMPEAAVQDGDWKDFPRFLKDPRQYFYAPDPTEDSASLGGTVATNASGARTYRFGRTREHVRALRVVLATGDVLELRRGEKIIDSSTAVRIIRQDRSSETFPVPSYESRHVKSATGYFGRKNMDLIDLFVGSEGTLGVITLVDVALSVAPDHTAMFLAFFSSEDDAVHFVIRIRSLNTSETPLNVHSLEYLDSNSLELVRRMKQNGQIGAGVNLPEDKRTTAILCEFSYQTLTEAIAFLEKPLEEFGSSLESAVTGTDERTITILKELRHSLPEAMNKIVAERKAQIQGMHKIGTDTSVPDEKLEAMMKSYRGLLEASNLEHYMFGHIAENHIHINLLPRSAEELTKAEGLALELAAEAVRLGGTVSAEHGIGKMKRSLLHVMFSDAEIGQMLATKRALDPNAILCPGNIIHF